MILLYSIPSRELTNDNFFIYSANFIFLYIFIRINSQSFKFIKHNYAYNSKK